MTRELENGQLEWTFEELDYIGALEDIAKEIAVLDEEYKETLKANDSRWMSVSLRISKLTRISIKIHRLYRGGRFDG